MSAEATLRQKLLTLKAEFDLEAKSHASVPGIISFFTGAHAEAEGYARCASLVEETVRLLDQHNVDSAQEKMAVLAREFRRITRVDLPLPDMAAAVGYDAAAGISPAPSSQADGLTLRVNDVLRGP